MLSIVVADKADQLYGVTLIYNYVLAVKAEGVFTSKGTGYHLPPRHALTGSLHPHPRPEERMVGR